MTQLTWTRDSTFLDSARNFQAVGIGVYEIPDGAAEEYLDHDGWVEPEDHEHEHTATQTDPAPTDRETEAETAAEESEFPILAESVDELEAALATGEYDDLDTLDALAAAEADGKNRSTALDAITTRRERVAADADAESESETGNEPSTDMGISTETEADGG